MLCIRHSASFLLLMVTCSVTWAQEIQFNRDIRPILAENCLHCHGPDSGTREAELRLDKEEGAKASVIVPGAPEKSALVERIQATDPDAVMPPPDSGKSLEPHERELLSKWIKDGAKWDRHWSFKPVVRPAVPQHDSAWPKNPIDAFVLARLQKEQLSPSPGADRRTLARRLSFDLTGLPPTGEDLKAFLNDESQQAVEKYVDRLLASPHYGERMAMMWLDAARYADSDGYQADSTRQNWPWRDWVIDAFNSNMPFDQFTIQQFAGDLLPDATPEQILATCFHRNHMHNGEGGRDPEESRIEYVRDRVNTVGTVWLGLTLECAQCHTHKYDPISHSEYYQLNAFFNSIDENGKAGGGAGPFLKYTSPNVEVGRADSLAWLKQKEEELKNVRAKELLAFPQWLEEQRQAIRAQQEFHSWQSFPADRLTTTGGTTLHQIDDVFEVTGEDPRHDDYLIVTAPQLNRITGLRLTVLPSPAAGGRLSHFPDGHIILTNLKVRLRSSSGAREQDLVIRRTAADHQSAASGRRYGPVSTVLDDDPRTGWQTTGRDATEARTAAFEFEEPIRLQPGESVVVELRQRSLRGYSNLQRFRLEWTDEGGEAPLALGRTPLEELAALAGDLPDKLKGRLENQFLADRPALQRAQRAVDGARRRRGQYDSAAKAQSVTVLKERGTPRETHVLVRGVWNNKGDVVDRGFPAAVANENTPAGTRMDLAKWLVSPKNPLTARVIVNRFWQNYFGDGLVRTPGDFGTQGEPPTHPLLLDWLSAEFVDSGWDVKHLQQLIVTSATYQQSSTVSQQLQQRDPENRLLARGARFRLPSWMIRDAALAASGLLERRIGGPPVFAFQPEGAWLDATMGRFRYEPSVGADLYRRSIYTFWRRSVGPTGMFDASKRRVCEVRIIRTNTPLHALNLLNDETFVESSVRLGLQAAQKATADQIAFLTDRVLGRKSSATENEILQRQLKSHMLEFRKVPEAAVQLLDIGQTTARPKDPNAAAALSLLASTLLNLDEAITHE